MKQVAAWLGNADPSFTLRTYVHLMARGSATRSSSEPVTAGRMHKVEASIIPDSVDHGYHVDFPLRASTSSSSSRSLSSRSSRGRRDAAAVAKVVIVSALYPEPNGQAETAFIEPGE